MQHPLYLVTSLILCTFPALAQSTLQTKPTPFTWDQSNDKGDWTTQQLSLSDRGFIMSGQAITTTVQLNSFSVIRSTPRHDSAYPAGKMWLAVLTNKETPSSAIAHSQLPIDFAVLQPGAVCSWTFDKSVILSALESYYFTILMDDGDGVFESDGSDKLSGLRIETHNTSIVDGNSSYAGLQGESLKDWAMKIVVTNTNSPAIVREPIKFSNIMTVGGVALAISPE